jgi:hypothetical protein
VHVPDSDYYSFDEVLNDLKLEEDELKRLVSAGEIRAFRDKNTMRFKAEDVARLRGQRVAPQDVELDELELELEDEVEVVSPGSAPSEVESIDLGDVSGAEELVLEEASPTGEVIDIGAGGQDEVEVAAAPRARTQRGTGSGVRRAPKAAPAATAAEPVESISEGGAVLVLMLAGALLLIVANFLVLDAAVGRASSALTRAVANMFS